MILKRDFKSTETTEVGVFPYYAFGAQITPHLLPLT